MRTLIMALLVMAIGSMLAGCQTMAHDQKQQIRKYSHISEVNRRLLAEDIDKYLLLDKPSRLTRWYIR
ncbi:MAG: hypothetical protein JW810_03730 [Sedimentisphaerales bacterium]|nr:hypothetical protein [Sedimentisphaerales bacterium]